MHVVAPKLIISVSGQLGARALRALTQTHNLIHGMQKKPIQAHEQLNNPKICNKIETKMHTSSE